jgi:hypothetical protein
MASAPTLAPPPSNGDSPNAPTTTPVAASPSPEQPSPAVQQGSKDLIEIVQRLRGIAKAYPQAAPIVAQMNEQMSELMRIIMQNQTPGEPAAPPA